VAHARDKRVKEQIEILEKYARKPMDQNRRESAIRKLGKIGGEHAARALLDVFDDPFVHLHDRAVSAWIEMLRGEEAAEVQTMLSYGGLRNHDPVVRRAIAVALGRTGGAELVEPFRNIIRSEKDGSVLEALAWGALRLREEPKLEGVFPRRLKHKDGRASFAVAQAAAHFDGQAAVRPLVATLKHRSRLARAGAVFALQRLDAMEGKHLDPLFEDGAPEPLMALAESLEFRTQFLPWPGAGVRMLERLLEHPSWRVRAAAVQGALRVWEKEIVELLIARLKHENGRILDDVRRALETYTGQAIGEDPDLWRAWWRRHHEDYNPGDRPKPDAAGNIRFRAGGLEPERDGTRTVAFFNIPLRSKRLGFIFDLSGSMKNAAKKGSDEGPTKMELLRTEFEKTLAGLAEDTTFDVFVYRYWTSYPPKTKLTRALGKMQPATPPNVRRALAWMKGEQPKGWGAFYEPMEALLAEDVDTIVLLSDGRPSRGRYDRDFRILDEFPRANRFRRVAVNTVLVGTKGADRKFMQELAAATGGRFQETGQ
jgi:HEAT repeat protein